MTNWTDWTQCSKSCGSGERTRIRRCEERRGRSSANPCQSTLFEREVCNPEPCPVYTEWSQWSQCSATCGSGVQERSRTCVRSSGSSRSLTCDGEPKQSRTCNPNRCPEWTSWSQWSECSRSCGGGKRSRQRQCQDQNGSEVKGGCPGQPEEVETCNTEPEKRCPELGPWSEWTPCTLTCGSGQRERHRECGLADVRNNGNPCQAPLREQEVCNREPCPVFTDWSEWSQCSRTCGSGEKRRSRRCVAFTQAASRLYCQGELEQTTECNTNQCPVWTEWSSWTVCSVSCGGGTKRRSRECRLPDGTKQAGLFCPGQKEETEPCNHGPDQKCPELGPWTEWSQCSVSCGSGKRSRSRQCGITPDRALGLYRHSNPCKQPLKEEEICNPQRCPRLTEWSDWTECSASCAGGFRRKTRQCVDDSGRSARQLMFDNPCKQALDVVEECNKQSCPEWTEWGEWTTCSKSCSGGQRRKFRQCVDKVKGNVHESQCSGDNELVEDCNTQDCPFWTEWSAWTECSASCGGGSRSQVRECKIPRSAGAPCEGESRKSEVCNDQPCPKWTDWTEWTECTATCGGGTQKRIRDCVLPDRSGSNGCSGEGYQIQDCNRETCPVWSAWTSWTECTVSCGGGKSIRTRKCGLPDELGPQRLDLLCPGEKQESKVCNKNNCPKPSPWSGWSECSASCGGGTRTKTRQCNQVTGRDSFGNPCKVDLIEMESCNNQDCPVWTPWTEWTECSKSCGGGTRKKVRECALPRHLSGQCQGDAVMTEECNPGNCPTLTPWSEWTQCSKSCGSGSQRRVRQCKLQSRNLNRNPCFEPLEEDRQCNPQDCPKWTDWSEWTECSASCGGGTRTKVRECKDGNEILGSGSCASGNDSVTEVCNPPDTHPCPMWTEWSQWSQCSTSCGRGKRNRGRECSTPTMRNGRFFCEGGPDYEEEECDSGECPQWSQWTEWSQCSQSCGGGSRTKYRTCPLGLG